MRKQFSEVGERGRNKTALFCLSRIFFWLLFFVFCADARAEVVYLKNGTVMKGRLVQKNEQFIVIAAGEGEAEARTTIFLDDINKMMTDEEFEKESFYGPLEVIKPLPVTRPFFQKDFIPVAVEGSDSSSYIQGLIQGEQKYRAGQDAAEAAAKSLEEEDPKSLFERFEQKRVELAKPDLTEKIERLSAAPRKGKGRISGVVTLADILGIQADLYVYLMEDAGGGKYISSEKMLFDKIKGEDITSSKVPYVIKGVPAGSYKVFAQWDISRPNVRIETSGEKVSLAYLGAQGDYSGMTKDAVSLGIDELRENINFPCATYIEKNRLTFDWGQKPAFRVKDIYYLQSYPEGKFYMIIRNLSPQPIDVLPLDIYINDRRIFSFAWELKDIPGHGEKEFDISAAFKGYQNITRGAAENILKFRVTFAGAKETEFEKTIYIFL
ncbi:MAG: hypothetical protein WC732_09325 [Candidatus Omnitrophota bacterium]